jgi:hypothetical protein
MLQQQEQELAQKQQAIAARELPFQISAEDAAGGVYGPIMYINVKRKTLLTRVVNAIEKQRSERGFVHGRISTLSYKIAEGITLSIIIGVRDDFTVGNLMEGIDDDEPSITYTVA